MKEIEKLKIKAKKGNLKAIRELASKYYFGDKKTKHSHSIIPKNSEEAIRWSKIGISKGDTYCLDLLGYCYHMGDGVEQNNFKAKYYWELAEKKGSSSAQHNLGIFHENGWAVHKNAKKALSYYKKNIKKKNSNKNNSLKGIARIYIDGAGVKKNLKKGIKYYKIAAKGGDLRAMFELANIYDEKISFKRYEGIRKNQILAHKYYLLLAKKKFIFGEIQVAEFYLNKIKRGIDIKKNKKLYLQYMERARKNKNFDIIDQMNFPRDLTIALKEKYSKLLANIEK